MYPVCVTLWPVTTENSNRIASRSDRRDRLRHSEGARWARNERVFADERRWGLSGSECCGYSKSK